MVLWGEIFEDRICVALWDRRRVLCCGCPEQEVGYIYVVLSVLFCRISFQIVRDLDVNSLYHRESFFPYSISVNIGESNDFASCEDFEFVSELGLASCGKPYIGWHEGGADDGCLFGFYQGDFFYLDI